MQDLTPKLLYDSIGNIEFKTGVGDYEYNRTNGAGPHAVTRADLYEFEYDANGNMTRKSYNNNEKFQDISYDYNNRVATISNELNNRVDFVYDYTGRRVKKIYSGGLDTTYVNNFYEFKSDGTITKHIFDGTRRVVSNTSGVGPTWYHTDHLGSTNLLTDNDGNIIQLTEYYPYGETRFSEGEDITQYKFTGQEFDPETGLYFYISRYYDPIIARFISADSAIPDTYNPQDFNRYTYVRNNPIIYSDPTGHFLFSAILVGAAISAASYTVTAAANNNFQFGNFLESLAIGAAAGAFGAAAGAGAHLLGKTALAGFGLGGVGSNLIAGALAGAAGLGAAYSTEVAARGGQWTWKGFGISAGIGLITGGIMGYYKSTDLWAYREGWENFWGKPIFSSPTELSPPFITGDFILRAVPPRTRWHRALDLRNPLGGKVYATEASQVVEVGTQASGVNYIRIRTVYTQYTTSYGHVTSTVNVGDWVRPGQCIGVTDLSGLNPTLNAWQGPHLHFSTWLPSGPRCNPAIYLMNTGIGLTW